MDNDELRQAAANLDTDYTLSIEDAAERYDRAGLPRTLRTIQRYCAKGHLDCHRIEIPYGEKYLITAASVSKHIAYIEEVRQAMVGRDKSESVVHTNDQRIQKSDEAGGASTGHDEPRRAEADNELVSRYVARLENENGFLREQVTVKDTQIKDLTERARETNHLIAGLQRMLTPLLGRPSTSSPADHAHPHTFEHSGTGEEEPGGE